MSISLLYPTAVLARTLRGGTEMFAPTQRNEF